MFKMRSKDFTNECGRGEGRCRCVGEGEKNEYAAPDMPVRFARLPSAWDVLEGLIFIPLPDRAKVGEELIVDVRLAS